MATLVLDIETIGEPFDEMDEVTQNEITKRIDAPEGSDAYAQELADAKRGLVFSPLTGEIVAIGILDVEKNKGVVYFSTADQQVEAFEEQQMQYKPMDEKAMLNAFWDGARQYDTFVTYNGRGFDVPYLMARSAVHRVHITRDLMPPRFLTMQKFGPKHIDLQDQLSYYGAVRRPGSLHLWCRALGIESPKGEGVAGGDVAELYEQQKYSDIARYNSRDLFATKELYEHWREYMVPNERG